MAKSIVGGLATGAAAAVTAIQDGTLDATDAVTITLSVLTAWGLIYAVPNKPKTNS
jgi:hypothetical protein